jgi:beta-glucosidase
MSGVELDNPSSREGGTIVPVDIKEAVVHVKPLTPELTPATTPEDQSPSRDDTMAGRKIFELEKADDRAKELAAKLSLEEQVRRFLYCICDLRSLGLHGIPDSGW